MALRGGRAGDDRARSGALGHLDDDETVLKPASYLTMQTEVLLASGVGTRYGLGIGVTTVGGRRQLSHGGAVSGYVTANTIYPDERAAIVVFSNIYPGAAGPDSKIAEGIAKVIFDQADVEAAEALDQAKRIFAGLQQGKIERMLFTDNANAYFTDQAVADYQSSLGPLGEPSEFTQTRQGLRGGMRYRIFSIGCGGRTLELTTFMMPDGKLEQYLVSAAE